MNNKVEILAPAGDYATFKAVINAGADAVYLGGNMFGARAYAGNLSDEELLSAIDYAHLWGKKVYLTVNTLLKNNELYNKLYDYLKPLYEAGLDAVIVQDYGVMKFITEHFPLMPIHASTQMTITHPDYMDFLHKFNVTRIVPARELSIDEIKALHNYDDKMELECFVHGALCYCYSGMCMMSSFYGGRSGNRGRCAGTCRLSYEIDGKNKAILSLKDLCTLNILPQILEAGVYSLKIEGRMKSPEYAAGVTAIYRKYVDQYLNNPSNYRVEEVDVERLLMLFDRGGMTEGYYNQHNSKSMIADADKSDKSLEQKNAYETELSTKYVQESIKHPISISIDLFLGERAHIMIEGSFGKAEYWGTEPQKSINRPMSEADISKQLVKTGQTIYRVEQCTVRMSEGIFVPNKELNEYRRAAIGEYEKLCPDIVRRTALDFQYKSKHNNHNISTPIVTAKVLTEAQAMACIDSKVDRIYLESESMDETAMLQILETCHERGIECYYGMPRVIRGNCTILKDFDGYIIRNIAQKYHLVKQGISAPIVADYSIYAFNDISAEILYEEGFGNIFYPIELNERELEHLTLDNGELMVYGYIPLMVTANCIEKTMNRCHKGGATSGVITDRKNSDLRYMACCKYCYNVIYNGVVYDIRDKIGSFDNISPVGLNYSFTYEKESEVIEILHNKPLSASNAYTRGHFKNGVE